MNTLTKTITAAALLAATSPYATAQTVGRTVLGVEVNVAAIEAEGYSANQLIGANVHNEAGTSVGYVHDLILATNGETSLAILEVGGFLGIGSRWVAVPAELFEVGEADHVVVLPNATEASLSDIPQFTYTN